MPFLMLWLFRELQSRRLRSSILAGVSQTGRSCSAGHWTGGQLGGADGGQARGRYAAVATHRAMTQRYKGAGCLQHLLALP